MIRDQARAFVRNSARLIAESPDLAALGLVAFVFAASRAWMASRGFVFDLRMLDFGYQLLDPVLLADDARRSLWGLHAQPPLFNAFLAVVLDAFPAGHGAVLEWTWRATGLAMAWLAFVLMRDLGVGRRTATVVACAMTLSPGVALYEWWMFYTHPIACAQVAMAWCVARFAMRGGSAWAAGALAIAAALALVRSVYHPLWYVATALMVAWMAEPGARRRVLLLAAPGAIALAALVAKNGVAFGTWSTSSWLGMSLGKVAVFAMPAEERERLVADGTLPAVMRVDAFEAFSKYAAEGADVPAPAGVPALDDDMKSTGWPNMNHKGLIGVSREFGAGARAVLRREPAWYGRSVAASVWQFFKPTSEYLFLMENVGRAPAVDRTLNAVLFGKFGEHEFIKPGIGFTWERRVRGPAYIGFFVPAWMIAIGVHAAATAWRVRRGGAVRGRDGALLFAAFQIAWVSVFGIVLEVGENNRFRAEIEPLAFAYAGVLLALAMERVRGAKAR